MYFTSASPPDAAEEVPKVAGQVELSDIGDNGDAERGRALDGRLPPFGAVSAAIAGSDAFDFASCFTATSAGSRSRANLRNTRLLCAANNDGTRTNTTCGEGASTRLQKMAEKIAGPARIIHEIVGFGGRLARSRTKSSRLLSSLQRCSRILSG